VIVELHDDAAADLEAAIDWYESKAAGFGYELEAEVDAAMDRIAELPLAWPPWRSDRRFRFIRVLRFPYHLPYYVDGERAVIMAVAHDKRRRDYWEGRAPK
jgi:plasmid stabilization system protein ParE